MSKRANPTLTGVFVLGALALVVAAVLLLGGGRFFETKNEYVMYFDAAGTGLRVGAPVDFRGVRIGQVKEIRLNLDMRDLTMRIPVVIEVTPDSIQEIGSPGRERGVAEVRALVDKGMRAQLVQSSFVTGQLLVQMNIHPDAEPAELRIDPDTKLLELPTIPTTLARVQASLTEIIDRVRELPLEDIVTNLNSSLAGVSKVVNGPELIEAVRSAGAAFESIGELAQHLDAEVDPLADNVGEVVSSIAATLEQARGTLASANNAFQEDSPLRFELVRTLGEVSEAARTFRVLVDYLSRHPDALLYGKTGGGS